MSAPTSHRLPAPAPDLAPLPVAYYQPEGGEPEAPALPLSHYAWILRRHLWKILVFVVTCVLATYLISARLQPIYEATATVDVDRQAPSAVVGQDSNRIAAPNDADQFLATQIKLIQSDAVLRPVSQRLNLLGQENQLKDLDPARAQRTGRAPVVLKRLKITRPPNTYLLLISYRSPDPQLSADAANGIAESYLEHTYRIRTTSTASLAVFMEKQIEELKAKMERSGQALAQFEKELNVINPEEKTNILSARLLQLNTEYTNAQGDRVRKEAAWKSLKSGGLAAIQVSGQGESLARLAERLNEASERLAQVKITWGASHPEFRKAASAVTELQRQFETTRANIANRIEAEYRQAADREQMLAKSVSETKAESDHLNTRSFEYKQLKQEAEADKTLYNELVRKIREAGINAGFQNNNVRIADLALPPAKAVFPDIRLNLILAFLFSTLLAVGAAVLSDAVDTTVRDPEQTSRYLGTDVIAMLPAVRRASDLNSIAAPGNSQTDLALQVTEAHNGNGNGYHPKKYYRTIGGFEEAIRTLRNTILLGDLDSPKRSILITSAGAGEGKTTTAVHLAAAHAQQGKKTLLVDADLRRPSVHRKLGIKAQVGLSAVLTGEVAWRDAVQGVADLPALFVLPAGQPSHRAADLIGPRMGELLDEFAKEYDLVIIDSPPLLGFAEPLQMAGVAEGVLIVGRAGETRRKAIRNVLAALGRVRATVVGVVLNQVKRDTSAEGYSYYGYYYKSGYYSNREG
jgi:polysaccharide biosynthesis transport protein